MRGGGGVGGVWAGGSGVGEVDGGVGVDVGVRVSGLEIRQTAVFALLYNYFLSYISHLFFRSTWGTYSSNLLDMHISSAASRHQACL